MLCWALAPLFSLRLPLAERAQAHEAIAPAEGMMAGGLVAVLLAVGAYHLLFALRRRQARENLYFSLLCGLAALYAASVAPAFAAAAAHRVSPLRLELTALLAAGPVYMGLVARLFVLAPGRAARVVAGLCALGAVAAALLAGPALAVAVGPVRAAAALGVTASVAWAAHQRPPRRTYPLLLGMAALACALIWDLLASQGVLPVARLLPGVPGLAWLGFLAFVAAVGVETAGTFAQAEIEARTDPLTGLTRRHVFEEALAREAERRRRSGGMLILVVVDLDHFKGINDTYGHRAGDLVLERAGHLFRHNARNIDLTARLGGEEFAALLYDTDLSGGLTFVNRFRQRLGALEIAVPGGVVQGLTASVGIAVSSGWVDIDTLLDTADRAMYEAKRAGRDRVVTVTMDREGAGEELPG